MTGRRSNDDGIIDEVAIQRRMAGDKTVRLTRTERVELVRRWKASGQPISRVDKVAGLNRRRYLTGGGDQR